jgi:glycerol kinase
MDPKRKELASQSADGTDTLGAHQFRRPRQTAAPRRAMAPLECVGAIDQGTQSTRFFLYGRDGAPLASAQVPLAHAAPAAGWVEQDPEEIWATVQRAAAEALAAGAAAHGALRVLAVGIANQRETTVVWDAATGAPLHNAIVWNDARTAGVCAAAAAAHGGRDAFRAATGLPVSTYFSAYKLRWLLDNAPAVAEAAAAGRAAFGTVDSWLLFRLTGGAAGGGVHVTDATNASRTGLMELATLRWHAPTVAALGLGALALPSIRSSAEEYGRVAAAALPGLAGVPLAGCLGDQQAALLGQRCAAGEAKCTYGTGAFVLLHTGGAPVPSAHGLLTTLAHQLGAGAAPAFALEGAIAVAGAGVSWLRDNLGLVADAAESGPLAASVPDAGGVHFVPAFGGLLAPWWAADARGAILGLTHFTRRAHVVRAMLEAICHQVRDVLEAMAADAGGAALARLRVDGGAAQNDVLMQLQADALRVPVARPANLETTSLGAALAAGLAVGFWTREEVLGGAARGAGGAEFAPTGDAAAADAAHARWKQAVARAIGTAELSHAA